MNEDEATLAGAVSFACACGIALVMLILFVTGCATAEPKPEPLACVVPDGYVLVPTKDMQQFYGDVDTLLDRLSSCSKDYQYWKERKDCS